jgi:hypothetical protein
MADVRLGATLPESDLPADPDDPVAASGAGDDAVQGVVEIVETHLGEMDSEVARPEVRRQTVPDLAPPGNRDRPESMPSSATPRRMNGKTVVSSFAPPAQPAELDDCALEECLFGRAAPRRPISGRSRTGRRPTASCAGPGRSRGVSQSASPIFDEGCSPSALMGASSPKVP